MRSEASLSPVESYEYVIWVIFLPNTLLLVDSGLVSDNGIISEKIKKSNDALASMDGGTSLPQQQSVLGSSASSAYNLNKGSVVSLSRNNPPLSASSSNFFPLPTAVLGGVFLADLAPLEQLVVRQLVALKLQTMMEKHLTYEEISEMTEPGKPKVWGKLFGAFKGGKKSESKKGMWTLSPFIK